MARKLTPLQYFNPETVFGNFTLRDGTLAFYLRIASFITDTTVLLDMGCGRGAWLDDPVKIRRDARNFRGRVCKVIGIDSDAAACHNPSLDEFRLWKEGSVPLEDASIDIVVCDYVLEHLVDPKAFFEEIVRVLKPDGLFFARTPNFFSYIGGACWLANKFGQLKMLSIFQPERKRQDVFPAFYRANSFLALVPKLDKNFEFQIVGYEAEVGYCKYSWTMNILHNIYSRIMPKCFATNLFIFARKLG
jgi:SAM-dependent methyltransferase